MFILNTIGDLVGMATNPAGALMNMAGQAFGGGQGGQQVQQMLQQLAGAGGNKSTLDKISGFLGKSVLIDPKKEFEIRQKEKEQGKAGFLNSLIFFLKKYVVSWGVVVSAVSAIVTFLTGRILQTQENPNVWLNTLNGITRLGALIGVVGSVWGQISGAVGRVYGDSKPLFIGKGKEIVDKLKQSVNNDELAKKADRTDLIFDDRIQAQIERATKQIDKPTKTVVIGYPESGKKEILEQIAGKIIKHETTKNSPVSILKLDGKDICDALRKLSENTPLGQSILSLVNIEGLSGVLPPSGPELLPTVIYGIQEKLEESKSNGSNQRLVIELTRVNQLWSLARNSDGSPNVELLAGIEKALCDLLNNDKYDVLLTADAYPQDDTLGMYATFYQHREALSQTGIGIGLKDSLNKINQIKIDIPEDEPKAGILASYLINNKRNLKIGGQVFNVETTNSEDLTTLIQQGIHARFKYVEERNKKVELKAELTADEVIDVDLNKLRREASSQWENKERLNTLSYGQIITAMNSLLQRQGSVIDLDTIINELVSHSKPLEQSRLDEISKTVDAWIGQIKGARAQEQKRREELEVNQQARERAVSELERTNSRTLDAIIKNENMRQDQALKALEILESLHKKYPLIAESQKYLEALDKVQEIILGTS